VTISKIINDGIGSITGDFTVDTNTLKVDSTNNRVGIGASPSSLLHIEVDERTAYDGSATDGQLDVGSTLFLEQSGGNNNAISQIVFQPRTGYGYNRIVNTGGSSPKMAFVTNNAERMRIDNSGNLLVGTTSSGVASSSSNAGIQLNSSADYIAVARSGGTALYLNRQSSDGTIADFRKDGTTVGTIGSVSGDIFFAGVDNNHAALRFAASSKTVIPVTTAGALSDNTTDLGQSNAQFDDIFASNSTIQPSDQTMKQDIASLTSAEITAAKAISKLFKTFKWKDKVTSKGDSARTHAGVIAQEVQSAMSDAGLDATKYAFFCSDTWYETYTDVPAVEANEENGTEEQDAYTRTDTYNTADEAPEGATERTRLGIRYPELLAFIGAATEQRLANIETRLTALEAE
jgi:hypothetical protein